MGKSIRDGRWFPLLLAALIPVYACEASRERTNKDSSEDASTDLDSDTDYSSDSDTGSDSDSGSDSDGDLDSDTDSESATDVIPGTAQSVLQGTYQIDGWSRLCSLAFSGTHIAITYGRGDDYPGYTLRFAVFPFDDPESAIVSVLPSACEQIGEPWAKPFGVEDGFAVWLRTWKMGIGLPWGCAASRVVMESDGSVFEDAVAYATPFYGKVWFSWFPDGILDGEDGLLTAQMYNPEPDGDEVVFRLDHLKPDGSQDNPLYEVYQWPEVFTPNDEVHAVFSRNHTFVHEDRILSMAIDFRWDGVSGLLSALASPDGEVLSPPAEVWEIPGNPDVSTHIVPTFAQRGGEVAVVLVHWDVVSGGPMSAGESLVMSFDGEVVSGPNQIPDLEWDQEYNSTMQFDGLAWSGKYFGFCYRPLNRGYRFIPLDSGGAPAGPSVPLLDVSELPIENGFCDVVALGKKRFLVAWTVRDGAHDVEPGLYVTYVDIEDTIFL